MQHCQNRSDKLRETSPMPSWRPPPCRIPYPAVVKPLQDEHQPRSTRDSLQEASLGRHFQDSTENLPFHGSVPDLVLEQSFRRSLDAKALPEHFALEGEPTKLRKVPPPPQQEQLDNDKLELDNLEQDSCTHRGQLRRALAAMHQAVHSLVTKLDGQQGPTNNNNNNNNHNNNNNTNATYTINNNNNEPNNYNNNNRRSRESGLNSLDLDNDNPESEPDLDSRSLFSFNPLGGVESSFRRPTRSRTKL